MSDLSNLQKSPADPSWRNNRHVFNHVPAALRSYISIKVKMSPLFRSLYLPNPRLSVTNLVKFPLPPMASSAAKYIVPDGHDWFSPDANHADLDLLRTVLVPPPSLIAQLIAECRQKWLDGAESISLPGSVHLFPLWTLDLWSEYQVTVKPQVDEWAAGIEWLSERALGVYQKEAKDTLRALSGLAWTGSIPYLTKVSPTQKFGNPVDSFARFLSRRWFSSRQIDQMTDYILDDIQSEVAPARDIRLMDMIITTEILKR